MRALAHYLDRQVDGGPVGLARIVTGIAAIFKGLLTMADMSQLRSGEYVTLPFPWQPANIVDSGVGTVAAASWIVFAVLFTVGFGSRVSGALLALSIFVVLLADQQLYSNHLYLLATLVILLTIAGPGSNYSIDRRFHLIDHTVPWWATILIRLQVTSVYLFAAVTKLNQEFMRGEVLEIALEPSIQEWITGFIALPTVAAVAVTTELFLAFGFWLPTFRWVALPMAAGFHLANVVVMDHGGMINFAVFGGVMLAMVLVHFTDVLARDEVRAAEPRPASPGARGAPGGNAPHGRSPGAEEAT